MSSSRWNTIGTYWVALVVAPLVLVGIELFHPAGFTNHPGAFDYLTTPEFFDGDFNALGYPGPEWWFTLHMIQTPLVVVYIAGLALLVRGLTSVWSGLARVGLLVFAVYYTALDSIGGIGLGQTLIEAKADCDPRLEDVVDGTAVIVCANGPAATAQYDAVRTSVDALWTNDWAGGVGSFVSLVASWAAFLAIALVAFSLVESGRARILPALLMAVGGWFLQLSHAAFNGPIAFASLAVAGTWLWFGVPGDRPPDQHWFPVGAGASAGGDRPPPG